MSYGNAWDLFYLPDSWLMALDSRMYHFHLQRVHYLVRMVHILSTSAFFGGIGLLDLRLMGVRGAVPLKPFAENVLPWLYATFFIAVLSGAALFFYDPVHVGRHAFFLPKMVLILAGLVNALIYNRTGYITALGASEKMPVSARVAGTISLIFWVGVMVCASLNAESVPKVFLR